MKVWLKEGSRFMGQVTIFDAEPSIELLMIAFPDAHAFSWRSHDNRFTVDVGDTPLIAAAD